MFKRLLLPALCLCVATVPAHADTTRFICKTEQSANAIGAAVAQGMDKGDEVAHALVMQGECLYLREAISVNIVQRGETYGAAFRVTVVKLSLKPAELPDMWGLVPAEKLHASSSI